MFKQIVAATVMTAFALSPMVSLAADQDQNAGGASGQDQSKMDNDCLSYGACSTQKAANLGSEYALVAVGVGVIGIVGAVIAGSGHGGGNGTTGTTGTK